MFNDYLLFARFLHAEKENTYNSNNNRNLKYKNEKGEEKNYGKS